ncbi:MAG TPA: hypothetical protein VKT25_00455 [Ktedonobacteraceae bacterium]|nr:hypothetical protein [Ktedonobacteraceae bacterium]
MKKLDDRVSLGLLCLLLLCILGFLFYSVMNTYQAVEHFQQQVHAVKSQDVSAVRPWMTIHVISHIYHVPEDYLCRSLHVQTTETYRHVTLYDLAGRKKQPVDQVVHTLQHAIQSYRKAHPDLYTPTPTRALHSRQKKMSSTFGRT